MSPAMDDDFEVISSSRTELQFRHKPTGIELTSKIVHHGPGKRDVELPTRAGAISLDPELQQKAWDFARRTIHVR